MLSRQRPVGRKSLTHPWLLLLRHAPKQCVSDVCVCVFINTSRPFIWSQFVSKDAAVVDEVNGFMSQKRIPVSLVSVLCRQRCPEITLPPPHNKSLFLKVVLLVVTVRLPEASVGPTFNTKKLLRFNLLLLLSSYYRILYYRI